jgi:hypothetical protein
MLDISKFKVFGKSKVDLSQSQADFSGYELVAPPWRLMVIQNSGRNVKFMVRPIVTRQVKSR